MTLDGISKVEYNDFFEMFEVTVSQFDYRSELHMNLRDCMGAGDPIPLQDSLWKFKIKPEMYREVVCRHTLRQRGVIC